MNKLLLICLIYISSVLSFSEKVKKNDDKGKLQVIKSEQHKKLGIELKTMLHSGYDFLVESGTIKAEVTVYKRFDVKNAVFNVGAGLDFSNYFTETKYLVGEIRPYFATEIGGYVSKDVRMYTELKLGGTLKFEGVSLRKSSPKAGISLGITYKERFTAELGYDFPLGLTLGLGARFGF